MAAPVSRVREYRKSAALAQRELAALIGLATQHACAELESGTKRPGLDVAIACALALGVPLEELFPTLAADIEHEMLLRARALYDALVYGHRTESATYVAALIRRLVSDLSS